MVRRIFLLALLLGIISFYSADAFDLPKWFPFNKKSALKEWQEKIFRNRVLYTVETKKEGGFLSAKSDQSCSGLIYRVKFDAKKFPLMNWQWRVIKFPDKANLPPGQEGGWLERDDYAARVYVIFSGWSFTSIRTLEYIWDENLPEGTILTSPYHKNIKLIVSESGKKNLNQWVLEQRNIYEDYRKAFGRAPTSPVTTIALMTDSDNTTSTAEATYKDIKVGYSHE